jgi:predicted amidohydrolase
MKIASAQIKSFAQNTEANIRNHLRMIELAAKRKVSLIIFPEMSLTGYELELAKSLALDKDDERLTIFNQKAIQYKMIIVAGAPIKIGDELYIGSFIFVPDGTTFIYTKQYLHTGEEVFFSSSSNFNPIIEWGGERISFAICADITNPLHPKAAAENATTLYAPSIFYATQAGIVEAYEQLRNYATTYGMQVLMSNYSGYSYGLESKGKSGYWDHTGKLIANMETDEEGLLVIEKDNNGFISNKVVASLQ